MLVLVVLIVAMLFARILGFQAAEIFDSWPAATRVGLSATFVFTYIAT